MTNVLCVSTGGTVSAAGCDLNGVCVHQEEHEEEGHDWLVCTGPQQLWRGGTGTLEPDEGPAWGAGVSMARPAGVLGPAGIQSCRISELSPTCCKISE